MKIINTYLVNKCAAFDDNSNLLYCGQMKPSVEPILILVNRGHTVMFHLF
jgi:hypothetical protein